MVTYKFSFFFNFVEKNSLIVKIFVSVAKHRPFTKRTIASMGCSIDDRDCGIVMANEYENVDQLLSRHDSYGGLFN